MAYTEKDFNLSWGDITIGQANTLVVTRPSAQYSFRFHYDFQGVSADVTAAYDPNFGEVFEKKNAAFLNYGVGLCKYTGARGKSGASDASAETVGYVRGIFDRAKVIWQIAELGKVDAGGGGTVAMYMANRNITTLDAGVPVLAMHAPFEVVSKLDCYETYKGMKAVYEAE